MTVSAGSKTHGPAVTTVTRAVFHCQEPCVAKSPQLAPRRGFRALADGWRSASKRNMLPAKNNHKKTRNYDDTKKIMINIYDPGSRFATTPPPPTWYGPKTCVLQHSAWKRCICSVFCMVGCWRGPQPCKFVGFLQPTFRKRVICNVSASTSWSSAAAPSSISVSNYHIILNLLLTVFSLGTGLISVYILCLSNFLLECLVFRNWSNLKFS